MPEPQVRVAIFGAGFGAYCLTPAFQQDPRANVVAICAPSPKRRENAANRYDIPSTFASYKELLDCGRIDAVALAVPPVAQTEIALACLAERIPVFSEKPFGENLKAAEKMCAAAQTANVPTAVDFLFPELASWREARKRLLSGSIGSMRHILVNWVFESYDVSNRYFGWKTDRNSGGGVMSYFGTHTAHYLEWFCGPIRSLKAALSHPASLKVDGDTLATVHIEFESGASGSVCICSAAPFGSGHCINFYGDDGFLSLENETSNPVSFKLSEMRRSAEVPTAIMPTEHDLKIADHIDPRVAAIARLATRFIDSVVSGKSMKPGFSEGLRAQRIVNRILLASNGKFEI